MSMAPRMQYFVGEFDGTTFHNENPANLVYRPDYGGDYYAAIGYNQLPSNAQPVMIGWINNWNYANDIPTTPWKGAMSLPRNISVRKTGSNWLLVQQPLKELASLRNSVLQLEKYNVSKEKMRALPEHNLKCSARSKQPLKRRLVLDSPLWQ